MADVVSRIVLQAQGGDQVAREIGKVKQAYKEAGDASAGLSSSGRSGTSFDAFNKATSTTGSSAPVVREQTNQRYNDQVIQRQNDHFSRTTGALRYQATNAIGAGSNVMSGNVAGGASQGMQGLAGAGTAGMIAGVAAAAIMGAQKLASKSDDLVGNYGTGLMQSLGVNNWKERGLGAITSATRNGFEESTFRAYLQSVKSSGGSYNQDLVLNTGRTALAYGIEGSTLGRAQGVRQQAGLGYDNETLDWMAYRGSAAFGKSSADRFISAVSTAIETSMARGISKSAYGDTDVYTNTTRMLSALGLQGGMDINGATATFNKIQQATTSAQSLSRPADVFAFMRARKPGMTYVDTLSKISTPGAEYDRYKQLKREAGGDYGLLQTLVMNTFGVDATAVDGTISAFENQISGERTSADVGVTNDQFIIETLESLGAKIGAGSQTRVAGWRNKLVQVYNSWQDRRAFRKSPENQALIAGTNVGTTISDMKRQTLMNMTDTDAPLRSLGAIDPSLQSFRDMTQATVDDYGSAGSVLTDLMPTLAAYERFKEGGIVGADEAKMYNMYAKDFEDLISLLADPEIGSFLASASGSAQFTSTLSDINKSKTVDTSTSLITVLELLVATLQTASDTGLIDDSATEEP